MPGPEETAGSASSGTSGGVRNASSLACSALASSRSRASSSLSARRTSSSASVPSPLRPGSPAWGDADRGAAGSARGCSVGGGACCSTGRTGSTGAGGGAGAGAQEMASVPTAARGDAGATASAAGGGNGAAASPAAAGPKLPAESVLRRPSAAAAASSASGCIALRSSTCGVSCAASAINLFMSSSILVSLPSRCFSSSSIS
mmetsp:Transcript_112829/g.313975  ORF Transcript_112829/g.313975 Transcript_112829/m.313975 type:complete len:203 (+) Transcript_112829:1759-2367(+)